MSEQFSNYGVALVGTGGIDSSSTTLPTLYRIGLPSSEVFRIRVEDEIMKVTTGGLSIANWTVVRGDEGTTAAAHAEGVPIAQVLTAQGIADAIAAGGGGGGGGMSNPMVTTGDIITGGSSGTPARLAIGTTGQVLTVTAGNPVWATSVAWANPMTTAGDLVVGGSAGVGTRLAKGSNGQVLTMVSGSLAWASPSFASPLVALGDTIYSNSSGVPQRLAIGTSGQVLTVALSGGPQWQTPTVYMSNPMLNAGEMIYGGTSGTPTRLGASSNGKFLSMVSGLPAWATAPVNLVGFMSSLPAPGSPGRLFIPVDAAEPFYDSGSAWVSLLRPGAAQTPAATSFSTYQQGTGDSFVGGSYVPLTASVGNTAGNALIKVGGNGVNIPFTFKVCMRYPKVMQASGPAGMMLSGALSTQPAIVFGIQNSGTQISMVVSKFSDINTFDSNYTLANSWDGKLLSCDGDFWFQVVQDSSHNRTYSFSNDGINFATVLTTTNSNRYSDASDWCLYFPSTVTKVVYSVTSWFTQN